MNNHTTHLLRSLLVFTLMTGLAAGSAVQAQDVFCSKQRPCDTVSMHFEPTIAEIDIDLDGLLAVLKQYTQPDVEATQGTRIRFVYGIGSAEGVTDAVISDEVIMIPGEPALIERGGGPLASPWDAFDDPLLGFDDPLLGFDDPLLGFDDPLLGYTDPTTPFIFDSPDDARETLEGIWGNGGTYTENGGPEYGLVLFSMTVEGSPANVQHRSAIVPFSLELEEGSPAKWAGAVPERAALEAAYPNPFNPQTTIRYALPEEVSVRLTVYDVLGREVAVLVDGVQPAGTHTAVFEAAGLPSGVYLYRLKAGTFAETRRLTLSK